MIQTNGIAESSYQVLKRNEKQFREGFLQPEKNYGIDLDKPIAPMIEQALESQKRGDQNQFRQVALYEESKAQSMPKNEEEYLQERKRMKEIGRAHV